MSSRRAGVSFNDLFGGSLIDRRGTGGYVRFLSEANGVREPSRKIDTSWSARWPDWQANEIFSGPTGLASLGSPGRLRTRGMWSRKPTGPAACTLHALPPNGPELSCTGRYKSSPEDTKTPAARRLPMSNELKACRCQLQRLVRRLAGIKQKSGETRMTQRVMRRGRAS